MAKFEKTYCSSCGGEFGPGESGFSHCQDHAPVCELCHGERYIRDASGYDQPCPHCPDDKSEEEARRIAELDHEANSQFGVGA